MESDKEVIRRWVEERKKKKKTGKFSAKYIVAIIIFLVLIVIVWLLVSHTCKKEKDVYVDLETGQVIDLDAEREAGTEIIWEEKNEEID
ncbi:hypothetical protein BQ9231_00545 [Cedratvirus lausannensis]|uniref:Uncharacterized protein n=2 Tax=Alphacedratvirus TaxID=3152632 RepID=A0A1M7XTX9_9VIRU|nr:Hypothetical protein BQ3484_76 [Cedratvirus A11]WIL02821.1 hypothetical protein Cbor_89 [Cedratvirus borely]WIL03464.1 hypothetical protein Cplu_84 [Cedratvirus plubellavi]SHO33144.1 Hypothetical protein BQ3484_76 [Cedratvirus A11]SOB74428.1 hypothetical protein BQ9231_00545 [Cedratvirus lausannensis]